MGPEGPPPPKRAARELFFAAGFLAAAGFLEVADFFVAMAFVPVAAGMAGGREEAR